MCVCVCVCVCVYLRALTMHYTLPHTHFPFLQNRTFPASGRPDRGKEIVRTNIATHSERRSGTFPTHIVDFLFLSGSFLFAATVENGFASFGDLGRDIPRCQTHQNMRGLKESFNVSRYSDAVSYSYAIL